MAKQSFKDIHALGESRIEEIDAMFGSGWGPKRIASVILNDWGAWDGRSHDAATKMLTRYKSQVIDRRLIRKLDKAGLADVRRFSEVFNPLNVAHEMAMTLAEAGYHAKKQIDNLREQNSPIIPTQHIGAVERAFKSSADYTTLLDKLGLRPKMRLTYREAVAPSEDPKVAKIEVTPQVAAAVQRIREALGDPYGTGDDEHSEDEPSALEA